MRDSHERELLRDLDDARDHLKRIRTIYRSYLTITAATVGALVFGYEFVPHFSDYSWVFVTVLIFEGLVAIFAAIGLAMIVDEGDIHSPWDDLKKAQRKYEDYLLSKADES